MNAELIVHLLENQLDLPQAKAVDAANPTSVAELTLAVMETAGLSIDIAKAIASEAPLGKQARRPAVEPVYDDELDDDLAEAESFRPSRNWRGTQADAKAAEVARQQAKGAPLCPNCQQSSLAHAPGCARASGEDPRAVTRQALPPLA